MSDLRAPNGDTPETVGELADKIAMFLTELGLTGVSVIGEIDSPVFNEAPLGWDLGQAFIGCELPGGVGVSIALGVTE